MQQKMIKIIKRQIMSPQITSSFYKMNKINPK